MVLALALSVALAAEPLSPEEAWAGVYVRATRTATVGAVMPAVAAGGFVAGLQVNRASGCQEMGCLLAPIAFTGLPLLAGPPLLAGGSSRACRALHELRVDVSCAAGQVAWVAVPALLLGVVVADDVPAIEVLAAIALPAGYATGWLQMGLNRYGWRHGVPLRVAVLPEIGDDYAGVRWAVAI